MPDYIARDGRSYAKVISHMGLPTTRERRLPVAVPVLCIARSHDGTLVRMLGELVSVARDGEGALVAFQAEYPGWGEAIDWVRPGCCTPLADIPVPGMID